MMTPESLDQLTSDLLANLAETPNLIKTLVSETGLDPSDLRRMSSSSTRDLSVALIDFICADDNRLSNFCEQSGWPIARVAYARAALEAGQLR